MIADRTNRVKINQNSAHIKYNEIKPAEKIYRILFDEFSLIPEECFFIDDSQTNVDMAEYVGMKAHCFGDRDIERLKQDMRNNNIVI